MAELKIHSENILPIIKKWLYSDKDIFLRELISNSCDAISKLKMLGEECDGKVEVRIEGKTLRITDNGIGMTAEEVEKYIAQIAFSGAEEFMQKYEKEGSEIIGHFGLGFYSAFMVSSKVEIQTLSYQEGAVSAHWECDGSSEYTINEGTRTSVGTEIILHISDEEYLKEEKLKEMMNRHCQYLPYPILLGETQINTQEPLWMKAPSECSEQEYLEFYRHLYPMQPDPMFWIHLNVDYPFNLKGILYFPKITKQFDMNKCQIELFCNRVFVSDNCKDLIPDYLMVLRGVLDSPDIPLNVSRSYLQMDKTVRQLATHTSKKVSDKLTQLHKTDKEKFSSVWPDIEMIIKLGCLQDDKFYERVKDLLMWKNVEGEWTHLDDVKKKDDKIFYTTSDEKQLLEMYKSQDLDVLDAGSYLDMPLFSMLEGKLSPVKFQRIDGALDDALLDKEREKTVLGADGKSEAATLADFVRSKLDNVEVEAKSLASDTVPGFVMVNEEMRRMRDYFSMTGQDLPPNMGEKHTFVVNTNNALIQSLQKLNGKDPELAKSLIEQLYNLSLLAQKELRPEALSDVISASTEVMTKLATHATK